jgi:hypothetical protein
VLGDGVVPFEIYRLTCRLFGTVCDLPSALPSIVKRRLNRLFLQKVFLACLAFTNAEQVVTVLYSHQIFSVYYSVQKKFI